MNIDENLAARPLQFVKVLSWSIFTVIFGFNLLLSMFIANYAERTLLEKQEKFGLLLAENVSHQVWTRFALPVIIGYGRISLRNDKQFSRLDQVVRSTIHSFKVLDLRIYDRKGIITYSLDKEELGDNGTIVEQVEQTWGTQDYSANISMKASKLATLFSYKLKPGTIVLTGYYPLRAEQNLAEGATNPVMGVLQIKQDITREYMTVINFERLIFASTLLTSMLLFFIIIMVMRRADRLNMQRILEKERLERELHQQEKLAGMGRMVAGVAHEIRNPLGIISSSAELILKKAKKEGSSSTRLLEALLEEAHRLSRTVGEFLDYARPRNPELLDVDLGRIQEQVHVFLEHECEKRGVTMTRDWEGQFPAKGDKDLLYRAFFNIAGNALQAIGGPGEIRTSIRQEENGTRVSIVDSGPGFAAENMDKVRDPFFTTKDEGTGLGLAIVGSILASHGATLELSNAPEGGARVDMFFPHQ